MATEDLPIQMTHVDEHGAAKMVDVGGKPTNTRIAMARSRVKLSLEAANAVRQNALNKGDCIQVARIAAIQATKWTSHLIPLCHAIPVDGVTVEHEWTDSETLTWIVQVTTTAKTGVEMEALTGASIAALTTYDMCKSIDKSIVVQDVCLISKSGGTHGDYRREKGFHA